MFLKTLLAIGLFQFISTKSLAPGKLLELEYSQRVVHGRYQSGDGIIGITFFSQEDDYLLVNTFDGKTLIDTGPFIDVDGWKVRSVYVLGLEYLQYTNPAYRSAHSDDPIDHHHLFSDAVQKLLKVKEVALLPEAAEAVGQRGLTGMNTPAVLPFFMFALRITQLHQSPLVINTTTVAHRQERRVLCKDKKDCPPCPNSNCLGQCGYECYCWSWACGDCCWHQACYDHDLCCVNFFTIPCLLPIGFRCDKPYKC